MRDQGARPAVAQLGDAVDAAGEDEQDGGGERDGEEGEARVGVRQGQGLRRLCSRFGFGFGSGCGCEIVMTLLRGRCRRRRHRCQLDEVSSLLSPHPPPTTGAPDKVTDERDKDEQTKHLEREARDHDVRTGRGVLVRLGRDAGESAARALQDQADDVAGDEDEGIVSRFNPGKGVFVVVFVFAAEEPHHVTHAEVYGGSEERRTQGQTADLHQKPVVAERVIVQHDAADVADDFGDAAQKDGDGEGRFAEEKDALEEVCESGQSEDGEEGDVCGEGRAVLVDALFERTGVQGALDVGHDEHSGLR